MERVGLSLCFFLVIIHNGYGQPDCSACEFLTQDECGQCIEECGWYNCACDHPVENRCSAVQTQCRSRSDAYDTCSTDECFGSDPCRFEEVVDDTAASSQCEFLHDDYSCWVFEGTCTMWDCGCVIDNKCTTTDRACFGVGDGGKAASWCENSVCTSDGSLGSCLTQESEVYEGRMICSYAAESDLSFCSEHVDYAVAILDLERVKSLDANAQELYDDYMAYIGDPSEECQTVAKEYICAKEVPRCSDLTEAGTFTGLKVCRWLCNEMSAVCGHWPEEWGGGSSWCDNTAAKSSTEDTFPCSPSSVTSISTLAALLPVIASVAWLLCL